MKRRDSLFALLSASISGSPLLVNAQELLPSRPFRIGLVPDFSPVWWQSMLQIFTQGLAEQGHIEGRDYVLIRCGVFYGPKAQQAIARVQVANGVRVSSDRIWDLLRMGRGKGRRSRR